MNKKGTRSDTRFLVELAVLIAIELLLEATGLGYIKTGILEFTIMQVPVIIAAIVLGPLGGAVLGGVFGLTSFWECFGKSYFGMMLMAVSPWRAFVVCFVPRLLMGLLCGLLYCVLGREKKSLFRCGAAGLAGALLNTVLFMSCLIMLFGSCDYILSLKDSFGTKSTLGFVVAMVGVQGMIEAVICCVLGASVSYGLLRARRQR